MLTSSWFYLLHFFPLWLYLSFIFNISNYSWPWTTQGLGALISYTVENPHLILQSTFFIPSSVSLDSTICGLCSTVILIRWNFLLLLPPRNRLSCYYVLQDPEPSASLTLTNAHNFTFAVFLVHLIVELNSVFPILIFIWKVIVLVLNQMVPSNVWKSLRFFSVCTHLYIFPFKRYSLWPDIFLQSLCQCTSM